jgi:hemerythrin
LFSVNPGGNERLRTTAPEPERPMVEAHAWNERLDLSHEAMDHEHHLQIGLVSAFVDAVEKGHPGMARRLVDQLVEYSIVHFGSEDLLMEGTSYPERDGHGREHTRFIEQMRELRRAYEEGEEEVASTSALDLRSALAAHMNDADRRLAAHVAPRARS